MKRFLHRLVAADSRPESEEFSNQDSADSVEWRDISIETNGPTGWASDVDSETREQSASETASDALDALDPDHLVRAILDGLAVPTLVVDAAGEIAYINSAACAAFDTTDSAAVGATPTVVHGGQQVVGQVLLTGEEIVDRQETVIVDGSKRTLNRTVRPLTDESAEIVGVIETVSEASHDTDASE